MSKPQSYSLEIFMPDGDPDGIRIIKRRLSHGTGLMLPRPLFPQIKSRPEFEQVGVYMLLGPRTNGEGDCLYIGEGDPVGPRIKQHFTDDDKDFWNRAIIFVAGPDVLNKAHVQFLEAELIRLAKEAKRVELKNKNSPLAPALSESEQSDMTVFLHSIILGMLPVLGIHAFLTEPTKVFSVSEANTISIRLTCKGKGATAYGYESSQGFIVLNGSLAIVKETATIPPRAHQERKDLIERGVLISDGTFYRFTQDFAFSSPSLASDVVLARSSNGRTEWKDENGRTLKDIRERDAKSIDAVPSAPRQLKVRSNMSAKLNNIKLECRKMGIIAHGQVTQNGFVILAGSQVSKLETKCMSLGMPKERQLRRELLNRDLLISDGENYRLTQDVTLSSPSLASNIVLGRSSNGRTEWKDESGRTLKQIQDAENEDL